MKHGQFFTKTKRLFISLFIFCFLLVLPLQTVVSETSPPIWTGPGSDIGAQTQNFTSDITETITTNLKDVGYALVRNVLNTVLGKLSYDLATFIASAGTGQESLVYKKPPGEYIKDMGDAALGSTLDSFAEGFGFDAAMMCEPPDNGFKILLGLDLEPYGPSKPWEPTCTFTEFSENWGELFEHPEFNDFISAQWDPSANPLGQVFLAAEYVAVQKEDAEAEAEIQRLMAAGGFRDKTEPVSGWILTPGKMIEDSWGAQVEGSQTTSFQMLGSPIADSASIFMNTLVSKLSKRIQQGIANLASGAELGEIIAGQSSGTSGGRQAAEAVYSSLNQPNFITTGTYDILTEFASCPAEGATSINCIMGSTLQVATQNKWTTQEFLDYLSEVQGNEEFKFAQDEINTPEEGLTYRAIIALKQYRIIPVGWQLAAEFIRSNPSVGNPTLKQLVDCYDVCGGNDEEIGECEYLYSYYPVAEGNVQFADPVSTNYSPFCKLVDPEWVLKSPENYCERQGPGEAVLAETFYDNDGLTSTQEERNLAHVESCVDNRACIQEEMEDVCTAYGYCSKEDRIYRSDGQTCDEAYASCQAFTSQEGDDEGDAYSYLKNTLNYNDCATDPGCKWYCLITDDSDSFICQDQDTVYDVCDNEDSAYYTNESCDCSLGKTCWVNAGSGGAEFDTYQVCQLGQCEDGNGNIAEVNGQEIYVTQTACQDAGHSWVGLEAQCDLGDNCGASHPNYDPTREQCLCTVSNTCTIEANSDDDINGDGVVDGNDISYPDNCDVEYETGETETCTLSAICDAENIAYSKSGYCSANLSGNACVVQPDQGSCVNDVGNTCELYHCVNDVTGDLHQSIDNEEDCNATGNHTWTAYSCTEDWADIDSTYCSCNPPVTSCEIEEGNYSCENDDGTTVILGTEEQENLEPEGINLVPDVSINFDNNLEECAEENAGCSEYIRILSDTNLLLNPSFSTYDTVTAGNEINDEFQDYFAFYAKTATACTEGYTPGTPEYDTTGECVGWQQHGDTTVYAVNDSYTGFAITNAYGTAITLPVSTGSISNTFDTTYELADRTFTFAYQATTPNSDAQLPSFKIESVDPSDPLAAADHEITIDNNLDNSEKQTLPYFNDEDQDGNYDIIPYDTSYIDYYYTVTFPHSVDDTAVKVTINAVNSELVIDIAQLAETEDWTLTYSDYAANNVEYLLSEDLECDRNDIGCELYTPMDQAYAAEVPAQITNPYSEACDYGEDFSGIECNQCTGSATQGEDYYVGCDYFQEMPLEYNVPLNHYYDQPWFTGLDADQKASVAKRTGYYCTDTDTSCLPNDPNNVCLAQNLTCDHTVSFAPQHATECAASAVGCEEYTNLDVVDQGGEGLEHYSYIRQCVKPTDPDTYTYHTWEGSDAEGYAIVLYNLKQSDADLAPCTNLDISSQDSNAACMDSDVVNYTVEDCTADYGIDPDCVKYYDDDLNIYYRYKSKTISVSEDCMPIRNNTDERTYHSIAAESTTCDADAVSCREYQGAAAGNIEQIINEDFSDNTTEEWNDALSTSNESVFTDDYSLRLDAGTPDDDPAYTATDESNIYHELYTSSTDDDGNTVYSSSVDAGATYIVTFWAKGDGVARTYLTGACEGSGDNLANCSGGWLGLADEYYFTEDGYSTTPADGDVTLSGDDWNYYILGPVYIPANADTDAATFRLFYQGNADDSAGYIDNIILEKSYSQYLIKDSFPTCYKYEGCKRYQDRASTTHYLKSFKRLCDEDAVGCEAIIDTANSSDTEFSEVFHTNNEYDNDDVIVPYDQVTAMIYDEEQACASNYKGCRALGKPDLNEQYNIIQDEYTTKYGLYDPDNFETLLCEDAQLSCKEYFSSYDGTVYFKDPGEKVCEFKQYTNDQGVTDYGWFKLDTESTSPNCPKRHSYAIPDQPKGSICNSNSLEKAGENCNNDADCYPEDWDDSQPVPRCISRIQDDINLYDCYCEGFTEVYDEDTCVNVLGSAWHCPEDHLYYDGNPYRIDENMDFGWVGLCSEDQSGCSEYIDPNSPNITEDATNGGFEDNVRNDILEQYFASGATEDSLPDYWYAGLQDMIMHGGVDKWVDAADETGASECYEQSDEYTHYGNNSVKFNDNYPLAGYCYIVNTPTTVDRDELYTYEIYFKVPYEAIQEDENDTSYKKFDVGANFLEFNNVDDTFDKVGASDFVADDLVITANDYEADGETGYSTWMRVFGNVGLGSTIEIPEGTDVIELFIEVYENDNNNYSGDVYFDDASLKENDKYYLIDYTVDGTLERQSFDNVHTCVDQDSGDETVNTGCVAFRDVLYDSQSYDQFGETCAACILTPNSDECRNLVNACDTNAVLKVQRDRICEEWIACETAEIIEDSQGNQKYTCFSLQPCDKINDEGQCTSWISKPTYEELDYDTDLTYYVRRGDTDRLYDIQNLTGYVKAGLMWGDYTMCNGGWNDGALCSSDTECLDQGECNVEYVPVLANQNTNIEVDAPYCVGGSLQGQYCINNSECDGEDDGSCSLVFTVEGYYPYGWMYEAGETGADLGKDLIEYGSFEGMYCQGQRIKTSIPCILNSYDEGASIDDYTTSQCWQQAFTAKIEDDNEDNDPVEGIPDDPDTEDEDESNLKSSDFFCANSPIFNEYFPFQGAVYTDEGWRAYGMSDKYVRVSQYEDRQVPPDNLDIDINNVLQVEPQSTDSIFTTGVQYDLINNIQQNGYYALSFKARYSDSYIQEGYYNPSAISIGLFHSNICDAQDDGLGNLECVNANQADDPMDIDWFIQGLGMADVVFVIDTSASMSGAITSVTSAAPYLAEQLSNESGVDVRFSIVDMDRITGYTTPYPDSCLSHGGDHEGHVNTLDLDLTGDIQKFSDVMTNSRFIDVGTGVTHVDPSEAIDAVINNNLGCVNPWNDSYPLRPNTPEISFRPESSKFIILVTDTIDEKPRGQGIGHGQQYSFSYDNNISPNDPGFLSDLGSSGFATYVITQGCINDAYDNENDCTSHVGNYLGNPYTWLPDYYSEMVNVSGGQVYTDIDEADWTSTVDDIVNRMTDQIEVFQFNQDLQTYTLGPIQIEERAPCTDSETCEQLETYRPGVAPNTDLVYLSNDGNYFQLDDVSLLPVLETNKALDPVSRTCRAYSSASDVECNYIEKNGTQHKGWMGYCLETDPENVNNCITWWPLDVIAGEASLYAREQGGYSGRSAVNTCLVSKGYERPGFCVDYNQDPGDNLMCEPNFEYAPNYPLNDWGDFAGQSTICGANVNDLNDVFDDAAAFERCHYGSKWGIFLNPYDQLGNDAAYFNCTLACIGHPDPIGCLRDCANLDTLAAEFIESPHVEVFHDDPGECGTRGDPYNCTEFEVEPYCENPNYFNEADCVDDESVWVENINIMDDYRDTGDCISIEEPENNFITFCHYDLNGDGIAEARTNRECTNELQDGDCQTSPNNQYTCQAYSCSGASNYDCNLGSEVDHPESQCADPASIAGFSSGYRLRTHEWQMHDPARAGVAAGKGNIHPSPLPGFPSMSHEVGVITRLPAGAARNIHYSEIEKIELYIGDADSGAHANSERPFWGQSIKYMPDSHDYFRLLTITDLQAGAVPEIGDEDGAGPWEHCYSYRKDSDSTGIGCYWWGQYDSKGRLENVESIEKQENPYDLVYSFGWSNYRHDGNKCDGTTCTMGSDAEKPLWRWYQISDNKQYGLESCCVENAAKYVIGWADTDGDGEGEYINASNNPWEHLNDTVRGYNNIIDGADLSTSQSIIFDADTDLNFNWAGWDNESQTKSHDGGNILSYWLDFSDDGYLQAVYTLIYYAASDTNDDISGVDLTYGNMMHLDYYLREPCAAVVEVVNSTGDNVAWAARASGTSEVESLFSDNYYFEDSYEPWGSMSPSEYNIGPLWDSVDEYDVDNPNNEFLATAYGQTPPIIWTPTEPEIEHGGKSYGCIGECNQQRCIGGDKETERDDCTDDPNICSGEAMCMGLGVSSVDELGYLQGFTTFKDQLRHAASEAQDKLKHIFADTCDSCQAFYVNYDGINRTECDESIFCPWDETGSDIWSPGAFIGMDRCSDSIRNPANAGNSSDYCGILPQLEDLKVDGATWGIEYEVDKGQSVKLQFRSVVDPEQEELRRVYIDWGDGRITNQRWDALSGDHSYTHAYSCGPEYAYYAHDYQAGIGCEYVGKVVVVDNWGWCSGEKTGDCDTVDGTQDNVTFNHCQLITGEQTPSWNAYSPEDFRSIDGYIDDNSTDITENCRSYSTFPFKIVVAEE